MRTILGLSLKQNQLNVIKTISHDIYGIPDPYYDNENKNEGFGEIIKEVFMSERDIDDQDRAENIKEIKVQVDQVRFL